MNIIYLKRTIKQNPLGAWILGIKESVEEKRLLRRRMPYLPAVKQVVGGGQYKYNNEQLLCRQDHAGHRNGV